MATFQFRPHILGRSISIATIINFRIIFVMIVVERDDSSPNYYYEENGQARIIN